MSALDGARSRVAVVIHAPVSVVVACAIRSRGVSVFVGHFCTHAKISFAKRGQEAGEEEEEEEEDQKAIWMQRDRPAESSTSPKMVILRLLIKRQVSKSR